MLKPGVYVCPKCKARVETTIECLDISCTKCNRKLDHRTRRARTKPKEATV